MEWFWKMVDHLQKNAAVTALQSFSPIDWIVLIAIFWGLMQGSRKGFSDMFGKLLGILVVSLVTLSFYQRGASYLKSQLPMFSMKVAEPFVFFLLSVVLWLSVSWAINFFGKFLKVEAQGLVKTLGGMLFGGLRMVLLLGFVAQFLLLIPIKPLQQCFKPGNTYTGYTISRVLPDLQRLIASPIKKPVFQNAVEPNKVHG